MFKKVLVAVAAMVMMIAGVLADTATVNGIEWYYTVSDGKAHLGGGSHYTDGYCEHYYDDYNGECHHSDGRCYHFAIDRDTSGAINIPSSLGGYPVTSIGDYAFYDCDGLTSITIPNSVTRIERNAFSSCSGLTSVTISDSVTSIGNNAFYNCSGLTSVTISDSVTYIGEGAFSGCWNLTSVTIPNSVTSIGEGAFRDCDNIVAVTIGEDICRNGLDVFPSYKSITTVVILDSVTDIGYGAFEGCSGLTSVTIPNSVTTIGHRAFASCSGLTSVTIGNSVTSIGQFAFSGCRNLTSITIPNSVTSIERSAFSGCDGLKSVTIPNSVTSIGWYAFFGCDKLEKVEIKSGEIGSLAFADCPNLKNVKIGKGVSKISFDDTHSSYSFNNSPVIFSVDSANMSYKSVNGLLLSKDGKTLLRGVNNSKVIIPNSVTSIGERAFYDCDGLTSVTIPNSVTRIGWYAFYSCDRLTSVTIPNSVTSIGGSAFSGCSGLTSVTIGNSVTSIGSDAFYYCSGLTSVTIPNSVTSIGSDAFYGCSKLKDIYFFGDAPEIGDDVFDYIAYNYVIWIKKGTYGWDGNYTSTALPQKWRGYSSLSYLPTYTVYYYANGGSGKTISQKMTCASNVKLRTNTFKRSGYIFLGWAKTKKGAVAYKNAASVSSLRNSPGTVKLYAVWAKKNYKVAFYANGGKGKMSAQTFTYGKAAKLKKNAFKRSGYTFIGWAKSASLAKKGTVSYKNTQAIKNLTTKGSTIKLYAVWAKTKYKVAFYANGGKGKMSAQTFTYGKAAKLKKNAFKRSGYTFIGWAKSAALAKKGTVSYKNTQAIKNLVKNGKTVKLYAVWKRK